MIADVRRGQVAIESKPPTFYNKRLTMNLQTIILVSCLTNLICLFCGYGIGMIKERLGWHKLIKKGVLPKPAYWGTPTRIVCTNELTRAKR